MSISKLEEIEQFFYDNNIQIIKDDSIHSKAFIVSGYGSKIIIYAPSMILSDTELREVLLHEVIHLQYKNGLYSLDDCIEKRRSIERMVDRKLIKRLIPFSKLISALEKHLTQYEIAEELGITNELLNKAISQYEGEIINWKTKKSLENQF